MNFGEQRMWEENLGYIFTEEETVLLRRKFLQQQIIPALKLRFKKYPQLRSAALFVAQYWDDEANDAVHQNTFFSVLETPDFDAIAANGSFRPDPENIPGFQRQYDLDRGGKYEEWVPWNDNGLAIPLFAAFCREGATQYMEDNEAYSLFAIFRKTSAGIEVEHSGEMIRPWLEGVCPERCEEFSPEELETLRVEWMRSLED